MTATEPVVIEERRAVRGLVDRVPFLIESCRGKRVLHVGCCDSPMTDEAIANRALLHPKLVDVASACIGADIDQASTEKLRALMPNETFVVADVCDPKELVALKPFDVIVMGEILEHLDSPAGALRALGKFLSREGVIVATVPNAMSIKAGLRAVLGRERVHRDHVAYFSARTLRALGERAELETAKLWAYSSKPQSLLKRALAFPVSLMTMISPMLADGLVVEYRRSKNSA